MAAVAVLAVLAVLAARGAAADPARGADAGDIDVLHYDVRFEIPSSAETETGGRETIRLRTIRGGAEEAALDAASSLTIEAVTEHGRPLRFEHKDERLHVLWPRPARAGEVRTIDVRYRLRAGRGLRVTPEEAFTVFNTWGWMVARTESGDRATAAFRLISGAGRRLVVTGDTGRTHALGDGRVEHEARLRTPWPAYLYGFASGSLEVVEHAAGRTRLRLLAPADVASGLAPVVLREADAMRQFFEGKAGVALPHRVYTQVFLPGAPPQEMVDLSLFSTNYAKALLADPHEDWAIAHELAHQWWGNLVTCRDWSHFWLSEGFATFLTAAWKEQRWGREAYDRELTLARTRLARVRAEGKDRPLVLTSWKTPGEAGGEIVYSRGALFLDTLRRELGEAAFWAGLRAYTIAGARTGLVETDDLRAAMEHASGRDLRPLFERWCRGLAPEAAAE
jgi:aminopeptidase N